MPSICFLFQVHQPFRLNWFNYEDPKQHDPETLLKRYFNMPLNQQIFEKVARKCYWPTNNLLLHLLESFKDKDRQFKVAFSLSGTFIEQCKLWDPDLLESFKDLARTGCVEFLDETYYHSLASIFDAEKEEFKEQVKLHNRAMRELFGQSPKILRNTEFIYNNGIAKCAEELGYAGIYAEGIERTLSGWRSPNYLYRPEGCEKIRLLLRNYGLSDDVGYRFGARWWPEWPLNSEKYSAWLSSSSGDVLNLCMDYETFGEHQWEDTGIFWFLNALPGHALKHDNLEFITPSEAVSRFKPVGVVDVGDFYTTSWADLERDTSAWIGNKMQLTVFNEMKALAGYVKATGDPKLMHMWRLLQTSDHYYYLCTKHWGDGDVHHYFSHIKDQQAGFANFMSIISDFKETVLTALPARTQTEKAQPIKNTSPKTR